MNKAAIDRAPGIGVAALCAAALLTCPPAAAGQTLIHTTTVERAHGVVELYQSSRRADGSEPPPQHRMVVQLPPRASVRFDRYRRCRLARLHTLGIAGCPRGALVGRGAISGSYEKQAVQAPVRLYNGARIGNRRTLLLYTQPSVGPVMVFVAKWIGRQLDIGLAFITIGYTPVPVLSNFAFAFRSRFLKAPCGSTWTATSLFTDGSRAGSSAVTRCLVAPPAHPAGG